jgi:hypothetical protein
LHGLGGGEVGGVGASRDVGMAGSVHGDANAVITVAAAEVGGVNEGRAIGRELRHKGVSNAVECGLQGMRGGEVG